MAAMADDVEPAWRDGKREGRRAAEKRCKEPAAADAPRCALWLPQKSRYCSFQPVAGHAFCSHHQASQGDAGAAHKERVPCPLDPGHSIFVKDLQKHLRICPRAKERQAEESLPCFERDVNSGGDSSAVGSDAAAGAPSGLLSSGAVYRFFGRMSTSKLDSLTAEACMSLLERVRVGYEATAAAQMRRAWGALDGRSAIEATAAAHMLEAPMPAATGGGAAHQATAAAQLGEASGTDNARCAGGGGRAADVESGMPPVADGLAASPAGPTLYPHLSSTKQGDRHGLALVNIDLLSGTLPAGDSLAALPAGPTLHSQLSSTKHGTQNAAVARRLRDLGLLSRDPLLLLDLGAGRGGLSAAIVEASPAPSGMRVLLFDRMKPRGCLDTHMAGRGAGVRRIKIDLRHLQMRQLPEMGWRDPTMVPGVATNDSRSSALPIEPLNASVHAPRRDASVVRTDPALLRSGAAISSSVATPPVEDGASALNSPIEASLVGKDPTSLQGAAMIHSAVISPPLGASRAGATSPDASVDASIIDARTGRECLPHRCAVADQPSNSTGYRRETTATAIQDATGPATDPVTGARSAHPRSLRRCAVAKHLCGEATDFALRAIIGSSGAGSGERGLDAAAKIGAGAAKGDDSGSASDDSARVGGESAKVCGDCSADPPADDGCLVDSLIIATCCHHRCRWETYVNQNWIGNELGFTREEFGWICAISTWATSEAWTVEGGIPAGSTQASGTEPRVAETGAAEAGVGVQTGGAEIGASRTGGAKAWAIEGGIEIGGKRAGAVEARVKVDGAHASGLGTFGGEATRAVATSEAWAVEGGIEIWSRTKNGGGKTIRPEASRARASSEARAIGEGLETRGAQTGPAETVGGEAGGPKAGALGAWAVEGGAEAGSGGAIRGARAGRYGSDRSSRSRASGAEMGEPDCHVVGGGKGARALTAGVESECRPASPHRDAADTFLEDAGAGEPDCHGAEDRQAARFCTADLSGRCRSASTKREEAEGESEDAGEPCCHGGEDPHTARLRTDLSGRLSPAERWRYGWQCKRLLDAGRMLFLKEKGYEGWMEEYCERTVSPENVLLIACMEGEKVARA